MQYYRNVNFPRVNVSRGCKHGIKREIQLSSFDTFPLYSSLSRFIEDYYTLGKTGYGKSSSSVDFACHFGSVLRGR